MECLCIFILDVKQLVAQFSPLYSMTTLTAHAQQLAQALPEWVLACVRDWVKRSRLFPLHSLSNHVRTSGNKILQTRNEPTHCIPVGMRWHVLLHSGLRKWLCKVLWPLLLTLSQQSRDGIKERVFADVLGIGVLPCGVAMNPRGVL